MEGDSLSEYRSARPSSSISACSFSRFATNARSAANCLARFLAFLAHALASSVGSSPSVLPVNLAASSRLFFALRRVVAGRQEGQHQDLAGRDKERMSNAPVYPFLQSSGEWTMKRGSA